MQHLIRISLICLFIASINVSPIRAQVAISDAPTPTPNGSAILDLQSTDKGVLVPRLILNDVLTPAPITAPATGLLIYNNGGAEADGFYFWYGGKWNEIIQTGRVFAYEQFGELYEIPPAGSPTLVELTTSTQWYGWTTSVAGTLSVGITVDTVNTFADKMHLSKYGLYKIQLSMSMGGTQNQQITSSVFVVNATDTTETRIKILSKISSAGDLISGSSIGVLELFPGDALDLRFTSTNNGEDLFIYSINLIATKIGE